MAPTIALFAETGLAVVMVEIGLLESASGSVEFLLLELALGVNVPILNRISLSSGVQGSV
jgi:hypothetical protein